ncbi:MAG: O-antigen ligase family protein, partial [Bryobacteraceae bacterium]
VGVLAVWFFFRASPAMKFVLLVGAVGALGVFSVTLPSYLQTRYATIMGNPTVAGVVGGGGIDEEAASAIESRMARATLLGQSIRLTVLNPIFGVGPGMFQVAASMEFEDQGMPGMWRESHNTFTQVSSETGLPGLALYVGAMWYCLRGIKRVERVAHREQRNSDIAQAAYCLRLAMIGFLATAMFASIAYRFLLPMLFGLCAAFMRVAEPELAMQRAAAAPRPATPPDPAPALTGMRR